MPQPKKIILLIGDILILYLALWLTLVIRYGQDLVAFEWGRHFWPFTIIYLLWLIVFYIAGLYELDLARNNIVFFSVLLKSLIINAVLAIAFFYFVPYYEITPKTNLFLNLVIFAFLLTGWRQIYNRLIKASALLQGVLIIGRHQESQQIAQIIKNNPQLGYQLAGLLEPEKIQTPFDLIELIIQKNVRFIVTAIDPHQDSGLVRNLYHCLPLKISFIDLASFYERVLGKVPVSVIGQVWFLENLTESEKHLYEGLKRILDMLGALILGLISLIFYPLIALVIKLDSPGPVFFSQPRMGQNGQIFKVIKFRSMIEEAEKNGPQWADQADHRVTRVGRFLRKTRLDELPQLWNIFSGQMSFVGPRPERLEFVNQLEKEIPYYQMRHLVKPGLTGWAQVNFRYGASVKDSLEKLQYELYYIKHRCLILDLSIILKTIKIILSGQGR